MKAIHRLAGVCHLLVTIAGCNVDTGPIETSSQQIDAGAAESVRADIRMSAGELRLEGGAPKLMNATYRYSQQIGAPGVRYDVTGAHGQLFVESPKTSQA